MKTLRATQVLLLSVWMGGELFFGYAVAPVAFSVLPSRHLAGLVVAGCLQILHWVGLSVGLSWLLFELLRRRSRLGWQALSISGAVLLTALSMFVLVPRMERDRLQAGGEIDSRTAASNVQMKAAADFTRLHPWSERGEAIVLLLGLGVLVTSVIEKGPASRY